MNQFSFLKVLIALVPLGLGAMSVGRGETSKSPTFGDDVFPLLKANCITCHGPEKAYGKLRLDSYDGLLKGGFSDKTVVSGNSSESDLITRIKGLGGLTQMPKGFRPLEADEIKKIEDWIDAGAKNDGGDQVHWSYLQPKRPVVPESISDWGNSPIDKFVFEDLKSIGLLPQKEADKFTLVRRVYLDVLGVPPTISEADNFLNDKKPGAYDRLIERVLANPHYGERQARIWLDLARYADSQGFEKDANRQIWPYRDYVISAFNRNIGFDDFTREQIAGDLLPRATVDQIVATGFHRNTMINEEGGVDQKEARWQTLVDRVATTSTVWLGSTLACAQCHDHKYDPLSQKEFYEMLAFFENSKEPTISLTPEIAAQKAELGRKIESLNQELAKEGISADEKASLEAKRKALQDQNSPLEEVTTMVMAPNPGVLAETPIREKGMFLSPGEIVPATTPRIMGPGPVPKARTSRLDLANWLVSEDNPLTARVQVNRMWEQHFGIGIVESLDDFGTQSAPNSHPKLLDWLAVEFMESGWDMKHIHRLILQSETYKQSSIVDENRLDKDPKNSMTSRGPRFRLDGEAIRDSVLAVSGLLTNKIGGASVMPFQPDGVWDTPYNGQKWTVASGEDRHRRSIYTFIKRSSPYPMFLTFDATSRETCTPRRIRTNTPLQALNTMNDKGLIEGAIALAKSGSQANQADPKKQIEIMFRKCLVRIPSAHELQGLIGLFDRRKEAYAKNLAEAKALCGEEDPNLAALVLVANVLMNTDEFLTLE